MKKLPIYKIMVRKGSEVSTFLRRSENLSESVRAIIFYQYSGIDDLKIETELFGYATVKEWEATFGNTFTIRIS